MYQRKMERVGAKVEYPNLLSRLFLRSVFNNQFVIPELPPRTMEWFLRSYESLVLRPNIDGISIHRPIFVIALPRSGSSMLQDIICTHPDIAYITNTMHIFRSCFCAAEHFRKRLNLDAKGERYLRDSVEVDSASPSEGIAFWVQWFHEDPYSLDYVERKIEDLDPSEVERINTTIRKVIWCFGDRANRFFSKNPGLLTRILLVKDLFPDAKFIHLVRDARMNANSLIKLYHLNEEQRERIRAKARLPLYHDQPFIPYPRLPRLAEYVDDYGLTDIRTTAHLWNDGVSFINEIKDKIPFFYEVRYEDILANPKEHIFKILEFCELPEIRKDNTEFWQKVSRVGVVSHKNVYGKFDVVESICESNMRRYGYL